MKKLYVLTLIVLLMGFGIHSCKPDDTDTLDEEVLTPTPYTIPRPPFFPQLPLTPENPTTVEGIQLGEMLFKDPILSVDNSMSCQSCHLPDKGFADNNPIGIGRDGTQLQRKSMPLMYLAYAQFGLMWDGKFASLEEQVDGPIMHPNELSIGWEELINRLSSHATYPDLFHRAFGTKGVTEERVRKALAQYQRTLMPATSRYDKARLNPNIMTESERRGEIVFFAEEKGDCFHCHGNILFTDNMFKNNGLDAAQSPEDYKDPGLGGITKKYDDYGKFKTPSLRNIGKRAPYMHDGRFKTLKEVIEHYNSGVKQSYNVDPNLEKHFVDGGLNLTEQDKTDLLNYLKMLDDE